MLITSQASSPLKRQLQLTDSSQPSPRSTRRFSGPPLPFQSPMNSFSACKAPFGVESSSSSAAQETPSNDADANTIPKNSNRMILFRTITGTRAGTGSYFDS